MLTDKELLMDRTIPRTAWEKYNQVKNIYREKKTNGGKISGASNKRLNKMSNLYGSSITYEDPGTKKAIEEAERNLYSEKNTLNDFKRKLEAIQNEIKKQELKVKAAEKELTVQKARAKK